MENPAGVSPELDPLGFYEQVENIINSTGGGHSYLVQTIYAAPAGGGDHPAKSYNLPPRAEGFFPPEKKQNQQTHKTK